MAKKVWKWIGFFTATFAISGAVIAVPFIASSAFWSDYRKNHADEYEALRYKIPSNLGSKVTESAFQYASGSDYSSLLIGDNKKFQDTIEGTYLFVGGNDFFNSWDDYQSFKGITGLFEENVRWTLTARGGNDPSAPYSSLGRFCINISKPNQTLREINENYDFKVKNLDPKNVVTIVGSEYINTNNIDKTLDEFENDLRTFVQNSLKLRNNKSNLIFIKHWKIPNPQNDPKIQKYNDNVEKLNTRSNRILSELTKDQIPRVLLVDNQDLFLNLDYEFYQYFDQNLNLTRIGNNEVAKSILATMKPIVATTGQEWTPANWTDYSKTHLNAVPLEWNTLDSKNSLNISVKASVENKDNNNIGTLTVSFPDGGVAPNDKLKWLLKFNNLAIRIEDYSVVNNNNQIIIDNIFLYGSSTSNGVTTNNDLYTLTVYDKNGNPFNAVNGDLSTATTAKEVRTSSSNSSSTNLSVAQQKFINKFNNKNKPMIWTFLGDSIDHGASFNQGFDNLVEVVEKSVKNDWKRYDDIFINAAQSGNFTSRAVDPYQIQSTITKYGADVVSIGLGISDGITATSNGQPTFATKEKYINNMKILIEAAKKANPDVIVVINAVNPTQAGGRNKVPGIYNPYLKEAFGTENSEYKDFVIYNEQVFTELNNIITNYTYSVNDQLFLGSDKLHPGGSANIIKGKTFLQSLGVDIGNSYLSNYTLQQFVWWTGTTAKPIQELNSVSQGNKVVPNTQTWASALPMGGSTSNNNLANIFIKYESNQKESERTYYLTTKYGVYTNAYWLMIEDGTYNVDAWAISKTPLSQSAQYAAKSPTATITISKTPTA
ncbi:SGNH/GDSL hydrolase family protein [Malacoplasma muris]|uniref:SGNH/GDSL hydrolase family protein n=1 Tax=Malacoplasma muris TaxID=2119 RepID=UPI00398F535B